MLYAKIVLGLPVEGPFDYMVPLELAQKIKAGSRVWVSLRLKKMLGYVVGTSGESHIKNLKSIIELIDIYPVLDKNMLLLTNKLSKFYRCSWGEAIETALPESLRKGKKITFSQTGFIAPRKDNPEGLLIHDFNKDERWKIYLEEISRTIKEGRSVIILFADINSVLSAKAMIEAKLNLSPSVLYRKESGELNEWLKIKSGESKIVIGTRSGIFAPAFNLGLIIIEEEQDSVYKQDQVPHYHARDIALMRAGIEKTNLILGSNAPSLESFYLSVKNRIKYLTLPRLSAPAQIKIVDMKFEHIRGRRGGIIFSKYLQDAISNSLSAKEKILLFLNRKGFATFASCHNCGKPINCPRCSINLVYHYKENILNCHYCNFKIEPPKICPQCNAGYIKFSGTGTEKIESELSRLFPQAKIQILDDEKQVGSHDFDIAVATSFVIKQKGYSFDLVGVLSVDNSLNRVDLRASEKTFALLSEILVITEKTLVIQTRLVNHHCFQALLKNDAGIFYKDELAQRKQLHFPPYAHLILIRLRGKKEENVKQASLALFEKLGKNNEKKTIKLLSVNPGQPAKLRGNFYWQILLGSGNVLACNKFLKINLKDFLHSGIILTVDVDPL